MLDVLCQVFEMSSDVSKAELLSTLAVPLRSDTTMMTLTIYMWSFGKCARWKRRKSAIASTSSYIEDTKLEQKYERPAWDKDFPKILPPPVRVPEKENKEVDVELDMKLDGAFKCDNKNLLTENGKKANDADVRRSEILDPEVFENITQGSRMSQKSKRGLREKSMQQYKERSARKNTRKESKSMKANPVKKEVQTSGSDKGKESSSGIDDEIARGNKNVRNSSEFDSRQKSEAKKCGNSQK
ncbi:unnamed protein product [Angiostrongylus costaricensis]|uniref:M-phase phosphoprotein 6 n=1 Tax=Angiostrongylus costaricensis TaxID=334426 RepID=A0A0R3PH35_ANGCS|nr:unnamed protein product [Angiostrongylus costaricensis]